MKRMFYVKALWDDEVNVWHSETNIDGLFIETKTLEKFEDIMPALANDMVLANHMPVTHEKNIRLKSCLQPSPGFHLQA
jgi:hypothetical protein